MNHKKDFTLVELLVVIAIIGILTSMLLPAVRDARTRAIESLCVSNLKQVYIGLTLYSDENNGLIPRPTNFSTGKHWPRYIYPYMSDDGFPTSNIKEFMETSTYAKVMYSPIVTGRRGSLSVHGMGRSDYGLNRYFLGANDTCNSLHNAVGKVEPLMVPIQGPSNPSVWNTDLGSSAKHAAYYYLKDIKTPGLFISGNVKFFSIAEGSAMNSQMGDKSELE
jgi:prepilin-type N-terminal cleavage/methylation domain-containing protein